ncbi:ComEA family DNA-binding protein [Pasteurella sp. PK-2025]|uniref:ComEA family DNA-binding protein n=1 Tax=unclassified Pasteurella TaxID=2621516 RepID=UPI003C745662
MTFKSLFVSIMTCCAVFTSTNVLADNSTNPTTDPTPVATQQVITDKVNINTATASELQKALIGIGAKKAEAIVQYREAHGAFTAVEQLLEVQGIGKATLEKNKARIML